MGSADHIANKFAANILYIIGSYVQNLVTIGIFSKKLQQKNGPKVVDPSIAAIIS